MVFTTEVYCVHCKKKKKLQNCSFFENSDAPYCDICYNQLVVECDICDKKISKLDAVRIDRYYCLDCLKNTPIQ